MFIMRNIKIIECSDIDEKYNYLEVFIVGDKVPFLDVSIDEDERLSFVFKKEVDLMYGDLIYILNYAKDYMVKNIENEKFFEEVIMKSDGI